MRSTGLMVLSRLASALTAGLVRKHNMVPALDIFPFLADLIHDPSALMPQNHWAIGFFPAVAEAYISMTDARGNNAHQDFIASRTFQLKRFDLQRATPLTQDSRLDFEHANVRTNQYLSPFWLPAFAFGHKFIFFCGTARVSRASSPVVAVARDYLTLLPEKRDEPVPDALRIGVVACQFPF